MSTSELSITKRRLLGGIAIAAVGLALTACSDGEDKAASAEPKPAVSNETTASTTPSAEIPTADRDVDMEAALKPGPLKEMALGDPNAPVKVIEYMSMTCPHCAHFHENTFEAIKTKYVDTGKVYFVLREFPFP
ncbi:MAG: thioredoxin domain-containing protein, partial [Allorhizobium sp.]